MITLSSIIEQFGAACIQQFQGKLLSSHRSALARMKNCRTQLTPKMKVACDDCGHVKFIPHSCGHRLCPHCQNHESQQWIERQCQKQVPVDYFMITFTLPAELRSLAWNHQKKVFNLLFESAWKTLSQFSLNDKKLGGTPGVISVLHTHSRQLDFHPHIHTVMPAATLDKKSRMWCKKESKYLFNHKALAKVFRALFLKGCIEQNIILPKRYPETWVVDCRQVGSGDKALIYLGRYLYRGVIREKDILSCKNGNVTFRYMESNSKQYKTRTLPGAQFLWLILQHTLPRRFRRARDYGFLHANSKSLIQTLHYVLKFDAKKWLKKIKPRPPMRCSCCGALMKIVQTRIKATELIMALCPPQPRGAVL